MIFKYQGERVEAVDRQNGLELSAIQWLAAKAPDSVVQPIEIYRAEKAQ